MSTCWSIEHNEMLSDDGSTSATLVPPLDDVESSTASAAITPYAFDYSLMATVFAILIFLWVQ